MPALLPVGLPRPVHSAPNGFDQVSPEAEIALLRSQLAHSQAQLRHADRLATVGRIALGLAHDLCSPLACALSNFSIVQSRVEAHITQASFDNVQCDHSPGIDGLQRQAGLALRQDLPELMQETRDGMTQAHSMLRTLQNFARADSTQQRRWSDLNQSVLATLSLASVLIRPRAEVSCELVPLPLVYCVPEQMGQVIMNLLVNAVQAMGDQRGLITVRSGFDAATVWIVIGDSGTGIAPHDLPHIFDNFFTTKAPGAGTGIGLSMVRNIVSMHGGSIQVDTEPGTGTSFRIVLPVGAQDRSEHADADGGQHG